MGQTMGDIALHPLSSPKRCRGMEMEGNHLLAGIGMRDDSLPSLAFVVERAHVWQSAGKTMSCILLSTMNPLAMGTELYPVS